MPDAERQKLIIISAGQEVLVGDKKYPKLPFKATCQGKELAYFSFKKALFDTIRAAVGTEIEADVETSTREHEGNMYTDRKLVQIYQGDKPMLSGGQGGRGYSPNPVAVWEAEHGHRLPDSPLTRASIERQTALKAVVELIVAGKAQLNELEVLFHRCYAIIRNGGEAKHMGGPAPTNKISVSKTDDTAPVPNQPLTTSASKAPPPVSPKEKEKQNTRFFDLVRRMGYDPRNALSLLKVETANEIPDYQEALNTLAALQGKPAPRFEEVKP